MKPRPEKSPAKSTSAAKRPVPPPQAHESSEEKEEEEEAHESSEEEEEEEEDDDAAGERRGSEDEEDFSEEEKDRIHGKIVKQRPQILKPKPPDAELSSSDDDESDSESEPLERKPPQPGTSVHTADPPSKFDPLKSPDPNKSVSTTAEKKKKRKGTEISGSAEEDEAAANGQSGKKLFKRVWTRDDVIALLKGMVECRERFGVDPSVPANIGSVLEIVKDTLHKEFSRSQLYEKIRRLKGKYKANLGRGENGADPVLPKAEDQLVFDLSKKIWGKMEQTGDEVAVVGENIGKKRRLKANAGTTATPGIPAAETLAMDGGKDGLAWRAVNMYPTLHGIVAQLESSNANSAMCGTFRRALDLLSPLRGIQLEEKWSRQCLAEMKLHTSRSKLMKELVDTLIEALGSPAS